MVGESFLCNIPREVIYSGIDINLFTPNTNHLARREKNNVDVMVESFMAIAKKNRQA